METKTPAYSLKAAVVLKKKKIELRFPEVMSETRPGKNGIQNIQKKLTFPHYQIIFEPLGFALNSMGF